MSAPEDLILPPKKKKKKPPPDEAEVQPPWPRAIFFVEMPDLFSISCKVLQVMIGDDMTTTQRSVVSPCNSLVG